MGLDGLFFARNDYRDKEQRMENKTLDMIWKAGMYFNFLIQYDFKLLHNIKVEPKLTFSYKKFTNSKFIRTISSDGSTFKALVLCKEIS